MITQFQRLFHRHKTWMFILLLLTFLLPFLFWDYSGSYSAGMGNRHFPKIFGKEVSPRQLETCRRIYQIFAPYTREDQIEQQLLSHLALVAKADQMGIKVSEAELIVALQQNFQTQGKFDQLKYANFLQNNVFPKGLNESEFGEGFKERIAIEKLQALILSTVRVPEPHVTAVASELTDLITVSYCPFDGADFTAQVKPTEDELAKFYEPRKSQFKTDELISISYVKFPIDPTPYKISEKEIEDYYQANKTTYTQPDGKVKALKDVSLSIQKHLALQKAKETAGRKAFEFSAKLTVTNPHQTAPQFEEICKQENLLPVQTGLFAIHTKLAGISNPDFTRKAFLLSKTIPIKDPVESDEGVFVQYFRERQESRELTFQEAHHLVQKAYIQLKTKELARAEGSQKMKEVAALIAAGKSFETAAKTLKLKVLTLSSFSMVSLQKMQEFPKDPVEFQVRYKSMPMPAGWMSNFEEVDSGGYFAMVTQRVKAPTEETTRIVPNVFNSITQQHQRAVFQDFIHSVLKEAGIKTTKTTEEG